MVLEGSTTIWDVANFQTPLSNQLYKASTPKISYLITSDGGDRKVISLFKQTALIALFLKHDMDEIIACHASAWLLYRIPLERVYSNANLGLQSIGLMRLVMDPDKKGWLKT